MAMPPGDDSEFDVGPATGGTVTATPPGHNSGLDVGPVTVMSTPPTDDSGLEVGPTTGRMATTMPLGDDSERLRPCRYGNLLHPNIICLLTPLLSLTTFLHSMHS
jgi:hypothetical protein